MDELINYLRDVRSGTIELGEQEIRRATVTFVCLILFLAAIVLYVLSTLQ